MSKFLIQKTATGVKFSLTAGNGQTVLDSEVYDTRAACIKGIESVRRNAPGAYVDDRTEPCVPQPHPKFELYQDRAGEYRFRLKSKNGRVIGISQGYSAKAGCLKGIESVMRNASDAQIQE